MVSSYKDFFTDDDSKLLRNLLSNIRYAVDKKNGVTTSNPKSLDDIYTQYVNPSGFSLGTPHNIYDDSGSSSAVSFSLSTYIASGKDTTKYNWKPAKTINLLTGYKYIQITFVNPFNAIDKGSTLSVTANFKNGSNTLFTIKGDIAGPASDNDDRKSVEIGGFANITNGNITEVDFSVPNIQDQVEEIFINGIKVTEYDVTQKDLKHFTTITGFLSDMADQIKAKNASKVSLGANTINMFNMPSLIEGNLDDAKVIIPYGKMEISNLHTQYTDEIDINNGNPSDGSMNIDLDTISPGSTGGSIWDSSTKSILLDNTYKKYLFLYMKNTDTEVVSSKTTISIVNDIDNSPTINALEDACVGYNIFAIPDDWFKGASSLSILENVYTVPNGPNPKMMVDIGKSYMIACKALPTISGGGISPVQPTQPTQSTQPTSKPTQPTQVTQPTSQPTSSKPASPTVLINETGLTAFNTSSYNLPVVPPVGVTKITVTLDITMGRANGTSTVTFPGTNVSLSIPNGSAIGRHTVTGTVAVTDSQTKAMSSVKVAMARICALRGIKIVAQ